jgi:opine dehydrogenase
LLTPVSNGGIAFKDAFENLYANYSLRKKSLAETLRQSPIHGSPAFTAPATVDTRYLNEELPFGLAPWSAIGRMLGIPTPNIDAVIRMASTMLGNDYFTLGLTVEDLGIEGMAPEDLKAMI